MIFKSELIEKILAREKTVTRRKVKGECRYKVGKTYALQPGRGQKAVGTIKVLSVERVPLCHRYDLREPAREGFQQWSDFTSYWRGLYGSYDPNEIVDRIEFELVEAHRD